MPIETDVPMEIDDYEKKYVFGLSIRKFICLVLAIAAAVGSSILFKKLSIPNNISGYLVPLVSVPFLILGFFKPDGRKAEDFFYLFYRRQAWKNKLTYISDPVGLDETIDLKEGGKINGSILVVSDPPECECQERFCPSRRMYSQHRTRTRKRIKAARKEFKKAQKAAKSLAKNAGAEIHS